MKILVFHEIEKPFRIQSKRKAVLKKLKNESYSIEVQAIFDTWFKDFLLNKHEIPNGEQFVLLLKSQFDSRNSSLVASESPSRGRSSTRSQTRRDDDAESS